MTAEQDQGEEYVSPTESDLDFCGKRGKEVKEQFDRLIELQLRGIEEFGVRPKGPSGLKTARYNMWLSRVWRVWTKKQELNNDDLLVVSVGVKHTNPNQSTQNK